MDTHNVWTFCIRICSVYLPYLLQPGDRRGVPRADVEIKVVLAIEHVKHVGYGRGVPRADVRVKRSPRDVAAERLRADGAEVEGGAECP